MSSFDKAFAKARKSGLKEFSFGGKKYNTKLKGETKSSLPATAKVGPSKPGIASKIRQSAEYDMDGMSHSTPGQARAKTIVPKDFTPLEGNRAAKNDFRQSESKRASDESIGTAYKAKTVSFLPHKSVDNTSSRPKYKLPKIF